MSDSSDGPKADRRLNTWKEIASFFGKDERTVRRWEATRGLPVRRIPGGARNSVFAYAAELENWLIAADVAPEADAEAVVDTPVKRPMRREMLVGFGVGAAAVVAGIALGRVGMTLLAPPPTANLSTEIESLYAQGVYLWDKRTPESLREARGVFEQIVARDPNFARGYAGLANTYNLLREYSDMPAAQAYAAAVEAGRQAVRLDPTDADAQCALAFAEFYGMRQVQSGLSRFTAALQLQPNSAQIHHWYGNALLHLGRFEQALAEIETAQRLDPAARSIMASKGLALFCVGSVDEAATLLVELSRREPDFSSPVLYLAYLELARGHYPEWLDRMEQTGRLREDGSRAIVAAAGRLGLGEGGYRDMVARMLRAEEQQVAAGTGLLYNVARMQSLAGEDAAAVRSLRQSLEASEELAMGLNIDPAFRPLRGNAGFRRLATEMGLAAA